MGVPSQKEGKFWDKPRTSETEMSAKHVWKKKSLKCSSPVKPRQEEELTFDVRVKVPDFCHFHCFVWN